MSNGGRNETIGHIIKNIIHLEFSNYFVMEAFEMSSWRILLTDGLQSAGKEILDPVSEVDDRKGIQPKNYYRRLAITMR